MTPSFCELNNMSVSIVTSDVTFVLKLGVPLQDLCRYYASHYQSITFEASDFFHCVIWLNESHFRI